jgi:hypothetical protein
MDQFRHALAEAPPDTDRFQLGIDVLWSMFQGPACDAWVELAVAARTDDELRPYAQAFAERHREEVDGIWRSIFGARDADNPFMEIGPKFVLALMDGLVLHRMSGYDEAPGRAEAVVAAAKALAAMALGTTPPDPHSSMR